MLIDLSVPRDINLPPAGLTGVEIHTIDELCGIAEAALALRRAELPKAYATLAAEVSRFTDWLHRRGTFA